LPCINGCKPSSGMTPVHAGISAGDGPPTDRRNLRQILQVDYSFPPNVAVSPECKDLLSRILIADPDQRITVQHILRHPWYIKVRAAACCPPGRCQSSTVLWQKAPDSHMPPVAALKPNWGLVPTTCHRFAACLPPLSSAAAQGSNANAGPEPSSLHGQFRNQLSAAQH